MIYKQTGIMVSSQNKKITDFINTLLITAKLESFC